jgi:hypothetical protein
VSGIQEPPPAIWSNKKPPAKVVQPAAAVAVGDDFTFDPTVVNSIVQPSSLVMGYVYRPYTSHTAVFGTRYFW